MAIPGMAACSLLVFSANAAAGEACTLTIRADGVGEAWTRELEAMRADLINRQDVDDCASIQLEPMRQGARIIVVLKDGRSTQRLVSDPADLRAVSAALVLLPSAVAPPATTPDQAPPDPNRASDHHGPALDDGGQTPAQPTMGEHPPTVSSSGLAIQNRTRVDLGGLGGSRWSGAAPAGSLGLFADVRLSEWVLGAYGRWDGYAPMSSSVGYTTQSIDVGAEAGREFRIRGTSLTLLAAPSVVSLSQKLQSTPPSVYLSALNPKTGAPIGYATPSARGGQVVRLGGVVRWTFVSHERLRLFLSADGEVDVISDPGNRIPPAFAATDPLPNWSAGLSVGGALSLWP